METLVDRIDGKLSPLCRTDTEWTNFIADYKLKILANSPSIIVTGEDVDRFNTKWYHFFEDKGCDPKIVWIAMFINGIDPFSPLRVMDELFIPDIDYISTLYRLFQTTRQLSSP